MCFIVLRFLDRILLCLFPESLCDNVVFNDVTITSSLCIRSVFDNIRSSNKFSIFLLN